MASHYEETEATLEDYPFQGELCTLKVSVSYRIVDYSPPQAYEDSEGEFELVGLRLISALVGCDQIEADEVQLKQLQKQINDDLAVWHQVEDLVCAQIS